jgi:WD40 repeat protein
MLYKTNIVLLVGLTDFGEFSPKKVTIWTTSKNLVLCSSFPFTTKITVAKINKVRMIVGERNFLHIYSTGDMKVLHTFGIPDISLGKLVLSGNSEKNVWLCFSTSKDEGMVKVYDTLYPTSMKTQIKAHKSPILKMSLNYEGDRLATCSCKGTIIRIFSLPKGDKLCTFKRGISSAFIFCLNFSRNSEKLISTSDTGMLHVFDIKEELDNLEKNKESKGIVKVLGRGLVTAVSVLMPKDYEDSFGTQGASITYTNESFKMSNLVGFSNDKIKEAFCFTSDGTFSVLTINYPNKTIEKSFERNMKDMKGNFDETSNI